MLKSEDVLGESPVDRPRRLEIVGDPRTMSIVPAILQGPFTPQIFSFFSFLSGISHQTASN